MTNAWPFIIIILLSWGLYAAMYHIIKVQSPLNKKKAEPAKDQPVAKIYFMKRSVRRLCADHIHIYPISKKHFAIVADKENCIYCKKDIDDGKNKA
jgi:hypothetical protein